MKRLYKYLSPLLVLGACTSVPPTNVHQPMSVRPSPRMEPVQANGAIYQESAARPLFEDRRARYVGDTITIRITENTSASSKSADKLDRSNSQKAALTAATGIAGKALPAEFGLTATSSTNFSGKGEASNNNAFTGSMTATVIDVYPNGNLLVSGEKQVAVGHEQEYVRVSGVVNPSFIDFSNMIDSSRIADARIEYKSAGQLSEGMSMGWLARFFLSVLPF